MVESVSVAHLNPILVRPVGVGMFHGIQQDVTRNAYRFRSPTNFSPN